MTKMTKEEMAKRIEELEKVNEELKKHSGQTVKDRIIELIESGMNTIEDLAETLSITSKNVSSNLTKIRHELSSKNETIITQRMNGKTMLAVVNLIDLGWTTVDVETVDVETE